MAKSIIHDNENCFICGTMATEWHHVFGGAPNRKLSEKYGLKVKLCHRCHRTGPQAVHTDRATRNAVQVIAQRRFNETYPDIEFIKIFGRNYL